MMSPAPPSQANTQQLALFLTHLSFRWILPLNKRNAIILFRENLSLPEHSIPAMHNKIPTNWISPC